MKIIIQSDMDFTPVGKRSVRYVADHKCIRGYVSGHRFAKFPATPEGAKQAAEWRDNTINLCPQKWETFEESP